MQNKQRLAPLPAGVNFRSKERAGWAGSATSMHHSLTQTRVGLGAGPPSFWTVSKRGAPHEAPRLQ